MGGKGQLKGSRWAALGICCMAAFVLGPGSARGAAGYESLPEERSADQDGEGSEAETASAGPSPLLPFGAVLGAGGAALALTHDGRGGRAGTGTRWNHERTHLSFSRSRMAEYLPSGLYYDEMTALAGEPDVGGGPGYSPHLLVRAPVAYGYGATGKGQIIAVLDGGFQLDHPEIAGKVERVYRRDQIPDCGADEDCQHGTHVASLAAGTRNGQGSFGLAFDARLHLTSWHTAEEENPLVHDGRSMRDAQRAGAVVHNNSWAMEEYGQERVRSEDIIRVVADPGAIDELAADVRADLQAFLDEEGIPREELLGNPFEVISLFDGALINYPEGFSGGGTAQDWQTYVEHLREFQKNGVIVFANSNYVPLSFAVISAALPEVFPELEGAWIAVSNVHFTYADPGDRKSSPLNVRRMSGPCAETAAYCLSHDGTDVLGAVPNNDYGTMTGSSMAAPQVSGAVALLAQAFPDHTPQQLTARLLATAENFGGWEELRRRDGNLVGRIGDREVILEEAPGEVGEKDFGDGVTHAYSSIYGHGFVNLAAAMQPVGGPPMLLVGDDFQRASRFFLVDSRIRLGPAFGDGLARGLAKAEVTTFDRLGGGFTTSLGNLVAVNSQVPDAADLLSGFARPPRFQTLAVRGGGRLEVAFRPKSQAALHAPYAQHGRNRALEPEVHLTMPLSGSVALSGWSNRSPLRSFGLRAEDRLQEELVLGRDAFANPYLGFVEDGQGAAIELGEAAGLGLRVGFFEGEHRDTQDWREEERDDNRVWGMAAELRLGFGKGGALGGLALTSGLLNESGTILGAKTSGAFATKDDTGTFFTGVAGHLALDRLGLRNLSLVGSAHWGWTKPRPEAASLFTGVSTIASESYSLGLQGRKLLDERDRFAVTLNQPLRVRGGSARLELPVGRTSDLGLRHRSYDVDLTPSGRELTLEASYGFRLNEAVDFATAVMFRRQPGHQRSAADEGIGLARLQVSF